MGWVTTRSVVAAGAALIVALAVLAMARPRPTDTTARAAAGPTVDNVVVILVDDMRFDDMIALPKTRALLGADGVTFENSFVNTSNCCPSRSTWVTGQRSANHHVLSSKWWQDDYYLALDHDNILPVWLAERGMETIHVGKYINATARVGLDPDVPNSKEIPPGWTNYHSFIGDRNYTAFDLTQNGVVRRFGGPGTYQTDILAQIGADAITDAVANDRPFYLWLTPYAPHTHLDDPPKPADRHKNAFDGVALPDVPSFNEADVRDKTNVIRSQPRLSGTRISALRKLHENRLESLLAVDDMVETIHDRLAGEGVLDRTLIIFSSDNGYLLGEHRLEGKIRVYEESTRVPLIMSGGSFTGGVSTDALVSNTDMVPTILGQLGIDPVIEMDGIDMSAVTSSPERYENRALIMEAAAGPAYAAVRTPRWMYVDYGNIGQELYEMIADPYQLDSIAGDPEHTETEQRLLGVLGTLRECRGTACHLDAEGRPLDTPPTSTTSPGPSTTIATSTTSTSTTSTTSTTTTTIPVGDHVAVSSAGSATTPSIDAIRTPGVIDVEWDSATATRFQLRDRILGEDWVWHPTSEETTFSISVVSNSTVHEVEVRQYSDRTWQEWNRLTVPGLVDEPSGGDGDLLGSRPRIGDAPSVAVTREGPAVIVRWEHPAATRYQLRWRELGHVWTAEPLTPDTEQKLSGLAQGTTYDAEVRARIDGSLGPWSGVRFTP